MQIGLTGGIACGKTMVARVLARLGARVVDADVVARDVVAPGTTGLDALVRAFGPSVQTANGHLDRAALGALVFADPTRRAQLEALLHPLIAQESQRQLHAAHATGAELVVYDAALLVEIGRADDFRPLVVVTAPPAVQIARLMARDGLSEADARQRLAAQMPIAEKASFGDHIIDNSGDKAATEARVIALYARLTHPALKEHT